MTGAFGDQTVRIVHALEPRAPELDMALIRDKLAGLACGDGAELNLAQPLPTAAFSRRDSLLKGYDAARAVVSAHGFPPIIRPVGGHLAVYDEGALVLHLWAPHRDARAHIRQRFEMIGGAMVKALRTLGVDARLGAVPGEYCDGEFSVNDSGRVKLVGTGQRITRTGFLFSAVVMADCAGPAREALTAAYDELGLALRPETIGCIADSVPGVTLRDVRDQLVATLGEVLPTAIVNGQGMGISA